MKLESRDTATDDLLGHFILAHQHKKKITFQNHLFEFLLHVCLLTAKNYSRAALFFEPDCFLNSNLWLLISLSNSRFMFAEQDKNLLQLFEMKVDNDSICT